MPEPQPQSTVTLHALCRYMKQNDGTSVLSFTSDKNGRVFVLLNGNVLLVIHDVGKDSAETIKSVLENLEYVFGHICTNSAPAEDTEKIEITTNNLITLAGLVRSAQVRVEVRGGHWYVVAKSNDEDPGNRYIGTSLVECLDGWRMRKE